MLLLKHPPPRGAPMHQRARQLGPEQVNDLVKSYDTGASTYELAERFGIHRLTVSAHLHRQGTHLRGAGLTTQQVEEAVAFYRAGWSLARIGSQSGVAAQTVSTALRLRGVLLRDSHGRER